MDKPTRENVPNVSLVPSPDVLRERLAKTKEELRRLMRESSKETDVHRQSNLQIQVAALNRLSASLMDQLGLTSLSATADPKREARRKFLPTQELTVDELLTLAAAGKATPEGAAALAELRNVPGIKSVIMPWVPPPFPASPDAHSVSAYMAGAKTYQPLQAVLRCPKDPHFKKEGGLKNLATVTQPPQYVGQDGEWIALLQQLPPQFTASRERVREALSKAVSGYYVASGPIEGWLARIMAGDKRSHPNFKLSESELEDVFAVLPWDKAKVPDFRTSTYLDLLKAVRINGAAGSGFPRYHKKAVVMREILTDAAQYYELLCNKKLVLYQQQNPGEFLTQAKMKLDRYEAEDWGKKVRPYYNINGGLALLYSCVIQAYSGALVGFWENPNSCNAHGFAWNSGGGDRLYAWLVWVSKQKPGVYAIGYSDDGIWAIKTEDGRVIVSDKDIAQCDASCGNSHLGTVRAHLMAVLRAMLTDGWVNIAHAAVQAIFRQVVVLYKSLVFVSDNKVHSGVPGTAEADQVAFATLYTLIRRLYSGYPIALDATERFKQAEREVRQRIGLEFKPSEWSEFLPDRDEYPWVFLGKRLHRFRGHYIPVVDFQKAVVQLVTPKSNRGGLEGQRAWMERARGLAVTSLFYHEELYELARSAYDRKIRTGVRPAATMDGEETGERDLDQILGQGLTIKFPNDNFPTRGWIYALYLGLPTQEATDVPVPVLQPMQTAASAFAEMFPEDEDDEPGAAWADREYHREREVVDVVLPDEAAQRIPAPGAHLPVAVRIEDTYQVAPLPLDVKEAYNAARRAAYQAFRKSQPAGKAGRYLRGGRIEQMLYPREDTVTFTKAGIVRSWETAAAFDAYMATTATDDDYVDDDYVAEDDLEIDARIEEEANARLEAAWNRSRRR